MLASLKDWRVFLEVAALRSISKASESLHISQPALSTKLRRLEDDLGFPLFERSWEGVKLSQEGAYFLPYAVQIMQSVRDAASVITPVSSERLRTFSEVVNDSCELRIGIDPWLMPVVMPLLERLLHERFMGKRLRLVAHPSLVLKALLRYGCLDIGFFFTLNENENRDFACDHLYEEDAVAIFREREGVTTFADFLASPESKELPFVLFDNPTLSHHSEITKKITETFHIEKFHIMNDIYLCMRMVNAGLAWTILRQSGAKSLEELAHVIGNVRVESLGNCLPRVNVTLGLGRGGGQPAMQLYEACQQVQTWH